MLSPQPKLGTWLILLVEYFLEPGDFERYQLLTINDSCFKKG